MIAWQGALACNVFSCGALRWKIIDPQSRGTPRYASVFAGRFPSSSETQPVLPGVFSPLLRVNIVVSEVLETSRGYWRRRKLASAWARVFTSTLCAAMMVSLHVGVQKGVAIRRWGVLENDISVLPRYDSPGVVRHTVGALEYRIDMQILEVQA